MSVTQNYGVLDEENNLTYAVSPLVINEENVWTNVPEKFVEAGYLPIIRSDMPEREGYYYTPAFHYEDSSIVESWIEHENPPEEPSYEELLEAVEIYKGGDFDE